MSSHSEPASTLIGSVASTFFQLRSDTATVTSVLHAGSPLSGAQFDRGEREATLFSSVPSPL